MAFDPELVQILKDIATGGAAVTGAIVAVLGLKTWKRQLKGTTEYDLARRALQRTYRARDQIQRIRAPMRFEGEVQTALEEQDYDPDEDGEPTEREKAEAWYNYHWSNLYETLNELQVDRLEAEALWGRHIQDVFRPLDEVVGSLRSAISQRLRIMEGGPHVDPTREQRLEMRERLYRRSYEPEDDDFTAEIENAVGKIEDEIRPHLTS